MSNKFKSWMYASLLMVWFAAVMTFISCREVEKPITTLPIETPVKLTLADRVEQVLPSVVHIRNLLFLHAGYHLISHFCYKSLFYH